MPSSSSPAAADPGGRVGRPVAAVALAAALAWGLFLALALDRWDGDVSRFVVAGDLFVDAERAPAGLSVLPDSAGYDGQFYYRLALDPFTRQAEDFGILIDTPAYRQQRILLPLVAHALSRGRPAVVPAALLGTNLACVVLLAALGAAFALRVGAPAWCGLAFSLYPGLSLSVARDLTEPLACAALLAGLLLLRSARPALAALPLSLALLARETAVLLPAAVFLAWLSTAPWLAARFGLPAVPWLAARLGLSTDPSPAAGFGRSTGCRARPPAAAWLAPGIVCGAWQAWIAASWDRPFLLGTVSRGLGRSGLGWLGGLARALRGETPAPLTGALEIAGLLAVGAALLFALRRSRASFVEKLGALLFVALFFTRGTSVWVEDWGFLRISSELWVATLAVLVQTPGRLASWPPALCIAAWWLVLPGLLGRL